MGFKKKYFMLQNTIFNKSVQGKDVVVTVFVRLYIELTKFRNVRHPVSTVFCKTEQSFKSSFGIIIFQGKSRITSNL